MLDWLILFKLGPQVLKYVFVPYWWYLWYFGMIENGCFSSTVESQTEKLSISKREMGTKFLSTLSTIKL